MNYIFFTLLAITSCTADPQWPVSLKNGQEMVVQTTKGGCFLFRHYNTRVKRINDQYIVSFNELHKTDPRCPSLECYSEFNIKNAIWTKNQFDTFLKTIRTDTSIQSTSFASNDVYIGNDTLHFFEGGGYCALIDKYYNKSNSNE